MDFVSCCSSLTEDFWLITVIFMLKWDRPLCTQGERPVSTSSFTRSLPDYCIATARLALIVHLLFARKNVVVQQHDGAVVSAAKVMVLILDLYFECRSHVLPVSSWVLLGFTSFLIQSKHMHLSSIENSKWVCIWVPTLFLFRCGPVMSWQHIQGITLPSPHNTWVRLKLSNNE